MKTKTNLLATGMFLAAVFNGFGQPSSQAPIPDDGLWQTVKRINTNASARTAFYRTMQP